MVQEVYGRRYSLIIGRPRRVDYVVPPPPSSIAKPQYQGEYPTTVHSREINSVTANESFGVTRLVIPAEYREYSDLHFTASIKSTKEDTSSNRAKCIIRLYNMAPDEYKFIKKGYNIILRAGYVQDLARDEPPTGIAAKDFEGDFRPEGSEDLPLVFVGDVRKVTTIKEGEDTITTLLCDDGTYAHRGIKVALNFVGEKTYKEIIEALIREGVKYGMTFGEIFLEPFGESNQISTDIDDNVSQITNVNSPSKLLETYVTDFCVHGYLMEQLETICESVGHKAYTCLGKIYIEPKYYNSKKPVLSVRSEDEVYYIRPEDDGSKITEGSEQDDNTVEVAMPLDARFSIASYLNITEGEYQGQRDVVSVSYEMDFEGQQWDTIIKARGR